MSDSRDQLVRALLQPKKYGKTKSESLASRGSNVNQHDASSNSISPNKQDDIQRLPNGTTARVPTLYNPRALLNPKASRNQSSKAKPSSLPATDERSSMATTSQGTTGLNDSVRGSRSMLEAFHGLENRAGRPNKRVKVASEDDNDDPSKPKFSFSRATGDGIIGKYMRPSNNKTGAAELANLVDLTKEEDLYDSDDDLKVVKSINLANEQEVCFGMLHTDVHAHAIPATSGKSQFTLPTQWPVIKCVLSREKPEDTVINVQDPESFVFGKVASDVARVLAPVMDTLRKFRTQARLTNRPKQPHEKPHDSCSSRMKMMVNVYGRRGDAEKIGRVFGQHNIWFKNPIGSEVGYPTCNPHASRAPMVLPPSTSRSAHLVAETRTIEEATQAVSRVFDHFANTAKPLDETEPSPSIRTPLLPHQKQALTFMLRQEQRRAFGSSEEENSSLWRTKLRPNGAIQYQEIVTGITVKNEPEQMYGGLLADVMGLGKTLEALSLVATTLEDAKAFGGNSFDRVEADEEIVQAKSRATLIVAPVSTVKNWEDQIAEHIVPGTVNYYVYHGPNREKDPIALADADIVISTYSTIAIECSKKATSLSPIRQIKWFRIILDEAHTIREPKATQSQAMYSLFATRRWCLTGTPIQNRIDDLGSLTKFLRLYPYDTALRFNQYVRGPAISGDANFLKALRIFVDSFTLRRLRDRINLPNRQNLIEKLQFTPAEQKLHDFFKESSRDQLEKLSKQPQSSTRPSGMQHSQVLRSIMTLRLISAHGRELLKEKDLERLRGRVAEDAIDVEDGSSLPKITQRAAYESLSLMAEAGLDMCRNCDKRITEESPHLKDEEADNVRAYVLPCHDMFCAECFEEIKPQLTATNENGVTVCPFCSTQMASENIAIDKTIAEVLDAAPDDTLVDSGEAFKQGDYRGPSTKTRALLRDLAEMREESRVYTSKGERPLKCVVFSEFTSHLDLLGRALSDNGYQFVRIDGTMSLPQRRRVLDELDGNDQITILLASIKAAGQGLNLTVASRAFIMEPLWNPAAEVQAVDRIYRIGQKREVVIKRYQMQDSIELQIIQLQDKKQKLADLSMNRNHQALSKKELRAENLKTLLELFK